MLAALRSDELRALVRHIDAAADGEAVRLRAHVSLAFVRVCTLLCTALARTQALHALTAVAPTCCLAMRHQALEAAMQQPRFREFADRVLDALHPRAA